jgi:hypothetical protein
MTIRLLLAVSLFLIAAATPAAYALDIPEAYCNESVFTPCICAGSVPKEIVFRPRLARCGGNAAVVLSGAWAGSFSVVLRDRLNRDRYPSAGYNGCTAEQAGGESPPAKCSAYKVQKKIRTKGQVTHCFGNKGTDSILSKATRLTIKIKDVPGSSRDPLARVCLNNFSTGQKLN